MESQKNRFYELLEEKINELHSSRREVFCITLAKYNDILHSLKLDKGVKCRFGNHFKFWCTKHFKLVNIGAHSIVYGKKTNTP